MTTVINFNFLNVIRQKFESYTINDVRSYNQYFDNGGQDEPRQWGEVIDVTPYSPALAGSENDGREFRSDRFKRELTTFIAHTEISKTYDRTGRTILCCPEKGAHVNAYA